MAQLSRIFICLFVFGLVVSIVPVGSASNGTSTKGLAESKTLEYVDLDDDSSPEVLLINFDFTDDGLTDRVIVYDRGNDMVQADDWRDAVDYRNDLFVYDSKANGQPELAIDFQMDGSVFVATLYDDRTGNLSYQLGSSHFQITKPESAAFTVRSSDPWIQRGKVSYDLYLNVSDPIRSSFTWAQYADRADRVQTSINVSDVDSDGIPDYSIRQIRTDLPQSAGQTRTEAMINNGEESILSPSDGILWPYIGSDGGYIKPYDEAPPPIKVNWSEGQVMTVGEFVASRGDEDNHFIYSPDRLTLGGISTLSFEYPFSFYDLAGDDDDRPELQVRMGYYEKGSRRGLGSYVQRTPTTIGELRYSWDQDNDGEWEYKFGGVGTTQYEDITHIGPYRFPSPGYENLPTWISDNEWRSAVFVVAPHGFSSTEGIYEGGYGQEGYRKALDFNTSEERIFNETSQGFRLEAADDYNDTPQLYYSPIDDQLHLYGISYGYWNHSNGEMKYEDLNDDPYVDRWTRSSNGENRSLYASDHGLMYATSDRVVISESSINESAFETSVPTTTAEWEQLRSEAGIQPKSNLTDLRSVIDNSDGSLTEFPELIATGGTTTTNSIRVYARVNEQLSYNGRIFDSGSSVVVVLDPGGIEIHELTGPNLQLSNVHATPSEVELGDPMTVGATITNNGWEEAKNISVGIRVDGLIVKEQRVRVGGRQSKTIQMRWWNREQVESAAIVLMHEDTSKQVKINASASWANPTFIDRFTNGMVSIPAAIGAFFAIFLAVIISWRDQFE